MSCPRRRDVDMSSDNHEVRAPQCPAGVCQFEITAADPDAMMGHLLVDHSWTFNTANGWMAENWPPMEEWPGVGK